MNLKSRLRGRDASIGRMIFHRGRSQSQYFLKCEKANLVVKFRRTLRDSARGGKKGEREREKKKGKKECDFVTARHDDVSISIKSELSINSKIIRPYISGGKNCFAIRAISLKIQNNRSKLSSRNTIVIHRLKKCY